MHSFYHAGDIGDVIYSLYVMKRLGGGKLILGTKTGYDEIAPRVGITMQIYNRLVTFLRLQPYCKDTAWMLEKPFVIEQRDLNRFRFFWKGVMHFDKQHKDVHLIEMMCRAASIDFQPEPWLQAAKIQVCPVIIARSQRQRDCHFPWRQVLERYRGRVGFVGFPEEHAVFEQAYGRVPRVETFTVLRLAEVLQGCELFVGNSSLPLAIAVGLGKRCVQEVSMETIVNAHTRTVFPWQLDWHPHGFEWPAV